MAGVPGPVTDQRPPERAMRIFNPVLRALLRSRAGRIVPAPFALLRFRGRRTGREYEIPVSLLGPDAAKAVFTSARWRLNFRDGAPVEVVHRGATHRATGTLVEDPDEVAAALQGILDAGAGRPRDVGLGVQPGHRLRGDDMRATGRTMIRIDYSE